MTPARWVARVASAVIVLLGGFVMLFYIGSQQPGLHPLPPEAVATAALSVPLFAGLLLAIFWKGIGEVIGGLLVIAAVVGFLICLAIYGVVPVLLIIPCAIVSLVFIGCGWYTLAHRHPHAPHALA